LIVPRFPGVNHQDAVRALEKAGFWVERQSKHIVMTNGERTLTIPRNNPINAITMGKILRDAGLDNDRFRQLL
jgi:predicted RNA binding protein YcfA (HicA-like mRNA interferase family)